MKKKKTGVQTALNFGQPVYRISIVFGESPDTLQEFEFQTEEAYYAFFAGIDAMNGWGEYRLVEDVLEDEDNLAYFAEVNESTPEESRYRLCLHNDRQSYPKENSPHGPYQFELKSDKSGKLHPKGKKYLVKLDL